MVALESTLISHGLPRPRNLAVARELEAVVRAAGAVPATIALVEGEARVGLDQSALETIAVGDGVVKCGVRDLAPVAARGGHGATTVGATAHLAALAGIRLFATGGLGRRAPRGARDMGRVRGSRHARAHRHRGGLCGREVDPRRGGDARAAGDPERDGGGLRQRSLPGLLSLRLRSRGAHGARTRPRSWRRSCSPVPRWGPRAAAVVVANPLPVDEQLDPGLHERVLASGLAEAARRGVGGQGRRRRSCSTTSTARRVGRASR